MPMYHHFDGRGMRNDSLIHFDVIAMNDRHLGRERGDERPLSDASVRDGKTSFQDIWYTHGRGARGEYEIQIWN